MAEQEQLDFLKKQLDDLNKRVAALGGGFFKDIDMAIASFGGGVEGARKAMNSLNAELKNLNTDVNYFYEALKNITKELSGQKNFNKDIAKSYSQLSSIANKLKFDQDGINELSQKDLEILEKKIKMQQTDLSSFLDKNKKAEQESLSEQARLNKLYDYYVAQEKENGSLTEKQKKRLNEIVNSISKEEKNYAKIVQHNSELEGFLAEENELGKKNTEGLQQLLAVTQQRLLEEKKINKTLGLSGAIVDGMIGSLGKLGINTTYFEDVKGDMREAAKSGNSWKVLMVGIEGIAKGIGKALTDPLTILNFIVSSLLKGSETMASFRKEIGISYAESYKLNTSLNAVGRATNDAYITGEKLAKSFIGLAQSMGFVADYGTDALITMTNLTGRLGLSNDEAAQLVTLSRMQSTNTESVLDNVGRTVSSMNAQKGTAILLKDVLKEIGTVSKAIALSLGGNPVKIAEAVTAARQLGTTLNQLDKTAESLLNFESSIDNELKAELLTGKEMNLERARAASLTNDYKTLSEEIGKNQEVINTFAKGNRLEQQAVAEALGMSRDELANMIFKQEAMKIGAEGVRAKYGQQAYESLKAQSAQEKFANAVEKLKSALSSIVQIFSPIIDALAFIAEGISIITSKWYILYPLIGIVALNYLPRLILGFSGIGASITGMTTGIAVFGRAIQNLVTGGGLRGFMDTMRAGGRLQRMRNLAPAAAPVTPPTPPVTPPGTPPAAGGGLMSGINTGAMLRGAAALLILSGALFVAAKAFQEFSKVEWEGVAKGTVALGALTLAAIALGRIKESITNGAIAIALLGVAILPASYAFNKFSEVSWGGVAKGTVALGVLTAAAVALGNFQGSIYKGALAIAALGTAILPAALSFNMFSKVDWGGVAKGTTALGVLATAAVALGNIQGSIYKGALAIAALGVAILPAAFSFNMFSKVDWGGVAKGTIALGTLSVAAIALGNLQGSILKGAIAIATLGIAILPAAYSFSKFGEVNWDAVAKGTVALGALSIAAIILGNIQGPILQGALAIAVLGAALIPAAFAFKMFSEVEWSSLAKAGVALIGLGVAGAIFGSFMPLMLMGAVAIAALGAALIPFGVALNIIAPALEKFTPLIKEFGNVITKVFSGIATVVTAAAAGISQIFTTLGNINAAQLLAIGPALVSIGVGLAALGGGSVVGAITGGIAKLFGGGALETLTQLALLGEPLNLVATSLQSIGTAFTQVSDALNKIDVNKLEALSEFSSDMQTSSMIGSIGSAIGSLITTPIKAIGSMIEGTEETAAANPTSGVDLTPMINAINEVKSSVDKLAAKQIIVNMDGRKVGTGTYAATTKVS